MIARIFFVVFGVALSSCASWVVDRNKIIDAYISQMKIKDSPTAEFRVTRCSEDDFGKNFECVRNLNSGEINPEACDEDKRLEKCEFIVHYRDSGCYFPTKGIRECHNHECNYIFSNYSVGVCN